MSAPRELSLVVRVHDICVALPAQHVTRLLLGDEIHPSREGAPGVLEVDGSVHAAWDLGLLLGMPALAAAWVLLAVPHPDGSVRVALRTGPCVAVVPLPPWSSLPPRAFVARARAMERAFPLRSIGGGKGFGVAVDPTQLFARSELAASAALQRTAAS